MQQFFRASFTAMGVVLGAALSGLFWWAAYAMQDLGVDLHEWPEGVTPHSHPPTDYGLMPVLSLALMLVPPLFIGGVFYAWCTGVLTGQTVDETERGT